MRNLFILFTCSPSPHVVMALDLIKKCWERGEEVFVLADDTRLPYTAGNPYGLKAIKYVARLRLLNILKKINFPLQNIFFTSRAPKKYKQKVKEFSPATLEDLQAFQIEGVDLGLGIYGSFASQQRDLVFDVSKNLKLLQNMAHTAVTVYETMLSLMDKIQPTALYICNGRWADVRPACRLAQARNIPCFLYDFGTTFHSYIAYDFFIFSIKEFHERVKKEWDNGGPEKYEIGKQWFIEQRLGKKSGSLSAMFLDRQKVGVMPPGFDPALRNIVIYNSSVDELAGFPEWHLFFHKNEVEGIEQMAEGCAQDPFIRLYVRIHPNLAHRNGSQVAALKQLADKKIPNLFFIWPNDPIDSYALLEAAEKVVAFHSTVGIESVFWGKPTILLGHSAYEDLDCVYKPMDPAALTELLLKKDLVPLSSEGALKYGYFFKATSQELKFFDNKFLTDNKALSEMFDIPLSPWQRIVRGIYQRLDDYSLKKLSLLSK